MAIPSHGTFDFDYGTFVDTPLAAWPSGYRELFLYGRMERQELAAWRRIIRTGDAVVDGGANYGYWTLVASRLAGPRGRVFSFEANPLTATKLEANVTASGCTNVRVYGCALGATEGTAEIHVAADNPIAGHASLHPHESWRWTEARQVQLVPMDEVARRDGWPTVRFIKLDIEGAELAALQGMERILRTDRPSLTVEWNVSAAAGFGYHPRQTVEFLTRLGFSFVNPGGAHAQPHVPPGEHDVTMMWFIHREARTTGAGLGQETRSKS